MYVTDSSRNALSRSTESSTAPEFPFEHDLDNVRQAAKTMRVTYPIAIDNDFSIWRAFDNNYWPALYLLDGEGKIRHQHFGEGEYEQSERNIQRLLKGGGARNVSSELVSVVPQGAEVAADWGNLKSPETYVGYGQAENFASPGGAAVDQRHVYACLLYTSDAADERSSVDLG